MKETKFTPGPWGVRFLNESQPEEGFFVEAPNNNMPELGYGIEILMEDFGEHNGYPLEQRLADARLIAAAPEMLEVLQHSRFALNVLMSQAPDNSDKDWIKDYIDVIEDTIKKVTE